MSIKKRYTDCNQEFFKDSTKQKSKETKEKEKISAMYEFGEEFFIKNKENVKR